MLSDVTYLQQMTARVFCVLHPRPDLTHTGWTDFLLSDLHATMKLLLLLYFVQLRNSVTRWVHNVYYVDVYCLGTNCPMLFYNKFWFLNISLKYLASSIWRYNHFCTHLEQIFKHFSLKDLITLLRKLRGHEATTSHQLIWRQ